MTAKKDKKSSSHQEDEKLIIYYNVKFYAVCFSRLGERIYDFNLSTGCNGHRYNIIEWNRNIHIFMFCLLLFFLFIL